MLLHWVFVLGIGMFAVASWLPRRVPWPALCVGGALVLLFGYGSMSLSFAARGPVWRASIVRSFEFPPHARHEKLARHHALLSPANEIVPPELDDYMAPLDTVVTFHLHPEGWVSDAQLDSRADLPAGIRMALVDSVERWRFGALPMDADGQTETVRVSLTNGSAILRRLRAGVAPFVLVILLWILSVWMLPIDREKTLPDCDPRRLAAVAGFLGLIGALIAIRLAPDMRSLGAGLKQCELVGFGLAVMVIAARCFAANTRWLMRLQGLGLVWIILGLVFLGLTRLPGLGTDNGTGAMLWVRTPLGAFQTIELVKLIMVFFAAAAAYAAMYRGAAEDAKGRTGFRVQARPLIERYKGIIGSFLLIMFAIVLMDDFGPVLLLALLLIGMLAAQTEYPLAGLGLLLLVLLLVGSYAIGVPHRWHDRVEAGRDPWTAQTADSSQLVEGREQLARGLWAVAAGGLMGSGLGFGLPSDIPEASSDFVFDSLAEELGWLGAAAILSMLVFITWTCLRMAARSDDAFEVVFDTGLGLLISIQAIVIVAGNIALFPLTGITLPWLSAGGSSIFVNYLGLGLLAGFTAQRRDRDLPLPVSKLPTVRKTLTVLSYFCAGLMGLLLAKVAWLQASPDHAQTLFVSRPGARIADPRLLASGQPYSPHVEPGRIRDRKGTVLALTTPRGRVHLTPDRDDSFLGEIEQGRTANGIEQTLSGVLLGEYPSPIHAGESGRLQGYDVRLTIDSRMQAIAMQLLQQYGYRGCIAGVDPQTGEILFLADNAGPASQDSAWRDSYNNDSDSLPFAYRRTYSPGSTFKTVVAATAIENHLALPDTQYLCRGYYRVGHVTVHDLEVRHEKNFHGHGLLDMATALEVSCNPTFARIGVQVGWDRLFDFCSNSEFNKPVSLIPDGLGPATPDFSMAASQITPGARPLDQVRREDRSRGVLALTAIGQENVRMTPLHLALWASAVGNGGRMPTPSLVASVSDSTGRVIWRRQEISGVKVMSARTAGLVSAMMENVVSGARGTGRDAAVPGIRIAGKTGTPEDDAGSTNAIFIAFAPVVNPKLAVAIVVEGRNGGGRTAGPLAAALFRAYL